MNAVTLHVSRTTGIAGSYSMCAPPLQARTACACPRCRLILSVPPRPRQARAPPCCMLVQHAPPPCCLLVQRAPPPCCMLVQRAACAPTAGIMLYLPLSQLTAADMPVLMIVTIPASSSSTPHATSIPGFHTSPAYLFHTRGLWGEAIGQPLVSVCVL